MLHITGLIHTHNDGARLGRTLESLRVCDELLVVDHGSNDDTFRVAQEYGAVLKTVKWGQEDEALRDAHHDWILSLLPSEALTESLEASLFEWKLVDHPASDAFCVEVREEHGGEWSPIGVSTRLLNRKAHRWKGELPPIYHRGTLLDGVLLRFLTP
jgi:glycosyltransferase involved in cell wall biosynthesis